MQKKLKGDEDEVEKVDQGEGEGDEASEEFWRRSANGQREDSIIEEVRRQGSGWREMEAVRPKSSEGKTISKRATVTDFEQE